MSYCYNVHDTRTRNQQAKLGKQFEITKHIFYSRLGNSVHYYVKILQLIGVY